MMPTRTLVLSLAVLFAVHVLSLGRAGDERKNLPSDNGREIILPSPVLRITSLEFKGLVSDLLFLKALVFEGSTYERKERPRVKTWEWQWLHQVFSASTDLDPYFFDPYFAANAFLAWEGGLIRETNTLLEKGTRYRDWDWMLPFFIGFNNFFFLQDNTKAAEYLITASQRPGPSEQLASLAARLAYKEKKTENAIIFLEAIEKKTEEQRLRKEYQTRLRALRARLRLERATSAYKQKYGVFPRTLDRLVEKGLLKEIPQDPYGGEFSIDSHGEIASTSDHLLMPAQR